MLEEGRRQRTEGFVQMGIQTQRVREPLNFQFGGSLKPLLPPVAQTVRARRVGINPFCLLPFLRKTILIHMTPAVILLLSQPLRLKLLCNFLAKTPISKFVTEIHPLEYLHSALQA